MCSSIFLTVMVSLLVLVNVCSSGETESSGEILGKLGFSHLSEAYDDSPVCWNGPTTIFAISESSLLTCPSCNIPLLLQEHTVPGLYSIEYLRTLAFGTKIETLASGTCITVTSSLFRQPRMFNSSHKVFIGGVEITRPDLYTSQNIVVHGLEGFISHLSPLSCQVERATSLSFPSQPLPSTSSFYINRVMLKDAMLRLRISGFSLLSLALKLHYNDLLDLQAMTIFALDDDSIFSSDDGNRYVSHLRLHIVPNSRLMAADLEGLAAGTVVPTMEWGESMVVTTAGRGGALDPMRINYVRVTKPDMVFNLKVAVHGVEVGFRRVNLAEAVGLARRIDRCELERDGVCEVTAPGVAPTAEDQRFDDV